MRTNEELRNATVAGLDPVEYLADASSVLVGAPEMIGEPVEGVEKPVLNICKTYRGAEAMLIYTPATPDTPAIRVMRSVAQDIEYDVSTPAQNIMLIGTDEEITNEAARLGF